MSGHCRCGVDSELLLEDIAIPFEHDRRRIDMFRAAILPGGRPECPTFASIANWR